MSSLLLPLLVVVVVVVSNRGRLFAAAAKPARDAALGLGSFVLNLPVSRINLLQRLLTGILSVLLEFPLGLRQLCSAPLDL